MTLPGNIKLPPLPFSIIAYQYTSDLRLLHLDGCRPTTPIRLPPQMDTTNTPLDWREWQRCLADHLDPGFRDYVVNGIRDGFRIGYEYDSGVPIRSSPSNMSSAREKPEVVCDYIPGDRMQRGESAWSVRPNPFPICSLKPVWGNT